MEHQRGREDDRAQADLTRWAEQHGGQRPGDGRVLPAFLALTRRAAETAVLRRVPPDAVTAAALAVAVAAVVPAAAGGRWALAAAALVVVSALLDGLDGALARLSGRTGPRGAVLDATADRCGDALLAVVLWLLGAPGPVCAAAGFAALLHEYVRARAGAAGMRGAGAITVAERPTRVVVVTVFAACQGALGAWPFGSAARWAQIGVAVWAAVSAVGLAQLGVAVRRALPASPRGR